MGKLLGSKKKSDSILAGQKPLKPLHQKKPRRRLFIRALSAVGVVAIGSFLLLLATDKIMLAVATAFPERVRAFQVELVAGEDAGPARQEKARKETLRLLKEHAGDLDAVAKHLQNTLPAKSVGLVDAGADRILASIVYRVPTLRVDADVMRLLSTDGEVYGEARTEPEKNLPLLSGLFDPKDTLVWSSEGAVVLDEVRTQSVKDALQLLANLKTSQLAFDEIRNIPSRGLSLVNQSEKFEVFLGRPPYDKKISRLEKILVKLRLKGVTAARIELDYEGKAFIKEKIL